MESMGKRRSLARAFAPEFKAEIVELCQRGDCSVGQVARDFDLTETAVREWVKQAEATPTPAATAAEHVRAGRARGVAAGEPSAAEDVDILKRATAFFAKETR